jgi:hypothetical protein
MRRAMVYATATASFCVEAVGTAALEGLTEPQVSQRATEIRDLYHLSLPPPGQPLSGFGS